MTIAKLETVQAGGGTGTASITGAGQKFCRRDLGRRVAYVEDSGCDTDMNVVMTEAGHFIEAGCSGRRWECRASIAALRKGVPWFEDVAKRQMAAMITSSSRMRGPNRI
ncbi:hypothetical protein [Massilia psychrophila]|uniref:hypothetical protein n=1 Tax=Massilia psychrophila TaxID=1603353 RepID=UPI001989B149|nr:hypothetical protein GCM10008020_32340 [Massilia psychrophila]